MDLYIVKTDNAGDILWTKTYGGTKPEHPNCILKTNDGHYFIVGYTQSFTSGDYNVYLLKIKNDGDTLWTKMYGGYGNEDGKEIIATSDGNYVIVGASNSIDYANYDMHLIKIDPDGNKIWEKYYGGPNYESARSVKECADGGFIVAGKTIPTGSSKASIRIVKTNAAGDTSWTKTLSGGSSSYEAKFILANNDGTYTLCIDDSSAGRDSDIKVIKLSANGTKTIDKIYGGLDKDICKMMQPTADGGYIIAGISRSFGWDNPEYWILKLDANCDSMWTNHFGSIGHEHAYAARETADGGYIVIGHTRSYSPNTQIMFIKLNKYGKYNLVSVESLALNANFNIYPNPTNGLLNINLESLELSDMSLTFKVRNALGQEIFSEVINNPSTKVINLKGANPGMYYVSILPTLPGNGTEPYTATQKFILQ